MAIILEPYKGRNSRHTCPSCGQKFKFTRYINEETGAYIAENVGRCDRESSCGYHLSPKQYFLTNPVNSMTKNYQSFKKVQKEPEKPIDYLPGDILAKTQRDYDKNNYHHFLSALYGSEIASALFDKYKVGTSKHWQGATIFWQVDINGNVRQCKIMLYNRETGRRVKAETSAMKWDDISAVYKEDIGGNDKVVIYGRLIMNRKFKDSNLQQCFFGEHLLKQDGIVAITEGEKTAMIASIYFPQFIWIATGGSNGTGFTRLEVCKVLKGREIIFFPDLGQYEKWSEKAKEVQTIIPCKVIVSDLLEKMAGPEERSQGWDLADFILVNQHNKFSENTEVAEVKEELQGRMETITTLSPTNRDHWEPVADFDDF